MKFDHVPALIARLSMSLLFLATAAFAGGGEFTGQFDTTLVANPEEVERVVFNPTTADKWKDAGSFADDAHITSTKLIDPITGKQSILALLVEVEDEAPLLFVDRDGDGRIAASEKFEMKEDGNPYIWLANVTVSVKGGFFTSASIVVRYFNRVEIEKMTPDDRLVIQSSEIMTRGTVDVNGKKVAVQYALVDKKKVDPKTGWLGMDIDGDGTIDMDGLSPEAAKADNEAVVFRVGEMYLSTKKADVEKNQIVLREHDAKEYKRIELYTGKEFPEFSFSDFDGKKRKFSEFRGKFVLLDIWGFWCPPCRKELPYLREANKRFSGRNLVVLGLNTDTDYTVDAMKKALKESGMIWTQAKFESVMEFLQGLRVNSFPTTFLISPEGKILSMSRHERKEPDLRGADLLESLDEVLPK